MSLPQKRKHSSCLKPDSDIENKSTKLTDQILFECNQPEVLPKKLQDLKDAVQNAQCSKVASILKTLTIDNDLDSRVLAFCLYSAVSQNKLLVCKKLILFGANCTHFDEDQKTVSIFLLKKGYVIYWDLY